MKIGTLQLETLAFAAPLAGVSNQVYRSICRDLGCELAFTEMVSAKALSYNSGNSLQILDISKDEPPIAVQIFGREPVIMAEAALLAEANGASLIDINYGCPAPKIVKNGDGSALMLEPDLAAQITEAVVKAVKIPVTVKFRLGWDEKNKNCLEFARKQELSGAAAMTLHGRTREQFYSGIADWSYITQLVKQTSLPVIGNGDVNSPEQAEKMLRTTGCSAVMVGRGYLGNPWIFKQINAFLTNGTKIPTEKWEEKIEILLLHAQRQVEWMGESYGIPEMRKHLSWYLKGGRDAAKYREMINRAESLQQIEELLSSFLRQQNDD
ncbi:MAG: tRNA dihydrouridine synthase DusB [Clostridia bacterium]